jgi:hypothetical protein
LVVFGIFGFSLLPMVFAFIKEKWLVKKLDSLTENEQ